MHSQSHLYREIADLRGQLADRDAAIAEFRKEHADAVEDFYGIADLTKREAEIVTTIVKRGRIASGDNTLSVHIRNIRKKLEPFGIEIKTIWSVGYEMNNESKKRLWSIPR